MKKKKFTRYAAWFFKARRFLERYHPYGFGGLNLWEISSFLVIAFSDVKTTMRSASISFRIFLAFFPAIITIFSLIPFIPIANFQEDVFLGIKSLLPGDTFHFIEGTLYDLINKKQSTLLSVGFVLMFYYASASMNAIMQAFQNSQHIEVSAHPFLVRIISFIMMVVLGVMFFLAMILSSISESTFLAMHEKGIIGDKGIIPFLSFGQWFISISFIYCIITILYNSGMNMRIRKNWKFLNTGSIFTTLLLIVTSFGFSYFLENFAQFNKLYGSLGTLMVILIWLNLNMVILLVGFDLNALIRKKLRATRLSKHKL
jgi:membrane protein